MNSEKSKTQLAVYTALNILGGVLSVLGLLAWILSPAFLGNLKMLVALVLIVLGCAIISYASKRHTIVKKGVAANESVKNMLVNLPKEYQVYEDVTIKKGAGEADLSRLIISPYGISIVDIKNHNGDISGKINDEMWKQDKFQLEDDKHKRDITNPVKEIRFKIRLLTSLLKDKDMPAFVEGCVYFPAADKITTNVKEVTNNANKILQFVQKNKKEVMTPEQIDKIKSILGL